MTDFYWNGVLIRSHQQRNKIAVQVAMDYCKENKICFREIVARGKTYRTVYQRVQVARYMRSIGFRIQMIAYALNRNHGAVVRYFDTERFKLIEPSTGHASQNNL